jgi:hypothetical protein
MNLKEAVAGGWLDTMKGAGKLTRKLLMKAAATTKDNNINLRKHSAEFR